MKSLKENFQKAHVVIIGSGIIGKFNALELSELGFQITIVDPAQLQNSSNAALGLLMGNMYQKRKGRSWDLRKKSIELWPKWIDFLIFIISSSSKFIFLCFKYLSSVFSKEIAFILQSLKEIIPFRFFVSKALFIFLINIESLSKIRKF